MSEERIEIIVVDRIDKDVPKKLTKIAQSSDVAASALKRLNAQISKLSTGKLNALISAYNKLAVTQSKVDANNKKSAILEERRIEATRRSAIARENLNSATKRAAIQEVRLSESIERQRSTAAKSAKAFEDAEAASQRRMKAEDSRVNAKIVQSQRLSTTRKKNSDAQIIRDQKIAAGLIRERTLLDKATRAQDRYNRSKEKFGATVKKASNSLFGFLSRFAILTGVLGTTTALLVRFIDSFTLLQNRLRVVAETEGQVATLTSKIADLAGRTRTDISATATAFSRFDRALVQLGASQEESIRLTETVNKSIKLSGANAGESAAGLLQLSQAFNKGKLDGDEFRTVMELLPDAADAIAKELKVTRGELLKLAPEGKITAEVMRNAFASVADEIDEKFAKSIPTIGESFTVLVDKVRIFLGEAGKTSGITGSVSTSILGLADSVKDLTIAMRNIFGWLGNVTSGYEKLDEKASTFNANIIKQRESAYSLRNFINTVIQAGAVVVEVVRTAITEFRRFFTYAFTGVVDFIVRSFDKAVKVANKGINFINKLSNKFLGTNLPTFEVDFSKFTSHGNEAFDKFADDFEKRIKALANKDFVGELFKDKSTKEPLRGKGKGTGTGTGTIENKFADSDGVEKLNTTVQKLNTTVQNLIDNLKQVGRLFSALNDINNETVNNLAQMNIDITASNIAFESGTIGLENYNTRLIAINAELARTHDMMGDATFFDGFLIAMDTWIGRFEGTITEAGTIFGNFAKSISDGFADSFGQAIVFSDKLGKSMMNVAKNALAGLISGLVKLGLKMALTAVLGQSLAVQAATTSTAIAAELGTAWAAPAALASLATLGTNAVSASAALTGTNALAQTLAGVPGFQLGGYTGDGGLNDVAGVVHKKEFVMPADITAENRDVLEAMKNKQPLPINSNEGSTKVIENNYYISDVMTQEELAQKYVNIREVADKRNFKPKG